MGIFVNSQYYYKKMVHIYSIPHFYCLDSDYVQSNAHLQSIADCMCLHRVFATFLSVYAICKATLPFSNIIVKRDILYRKKMKEDLFLLYIKECTWK